MSVVEPTSVFDGPDAPDPAAGQSPAGTFARQQEAIVTLTHALWVANEEADRLREGIQAILDDAWLSRADEVMEALRELLA